jgi:hypothetical protein
MTFGWKYEPRQFFRDRVFRDRVFRDSGAPENAARDNEQEVIGTQLRFGIGRLPYAGSAESEER